MTTTRPRTRTAARIAGIALSAVAGSVFASAAPAAACTTELDVMTAPDAPYRADWAYVAFLIDWKQDPGLMPNR